MAFLLCFLTSLHLWCIKESGIQTPVRSLFWDMSLPSWSASSLHKVIFLASAPHLSYSLAWCVSSRSSLESVTGSCQITCLCIPHPPHRTTQFHKSSHLCAAGFLAECPSSGSRGWASAGQSFSICLSHVISPTSHFRAHHSHLSFLHCSSISSIF